MRRKDSIKTSSFLNLQSEYFSEKAKFQSSKEQSKAFEKPTGLKGIKRAIDVLDYKKQQSVEDDEWEKSRVALEKKARIYNDLSSKGKNISLGCISDDHLVDFSQKNSGLDASNTENFVSKLLDPEDEVVDEFGRTRSIKKGCNNEFFDFDKCHLREAYYDRSQVRTLGIGFYRFSPTFEEKRYQIENLKDRRMETIHEREGYAKLLERRKEYRMQRVAVAQARKLRLLQSS